MSVFGVRWAEYSHTIEENIIRSWRALVTYFNRNANVALAVEILKRMAFLTYLLNIFQRFHKRIQLNDLTILNSVTHIGSLRTAVIKLTERLRIGGWGECLANGLKENDDGKIFLAGIELHQGRAARY